MTISVRLGPTQPTSSKHSSNNIAVNFFSPGSKDNNTFNVYLIRIELKIKIEKNNNTFNVYLRRIELKIKI
jgi:hypothetical protein